MASFPQLKRIYRAFSFKEVERGKRGMLLSQDSLERDKRESYRELSSNERALQSNSAEVFIREWKVKVLSWIDLNWRAFVASIIND